MWRPGDRAAFKAGTGSRKARIERATVGHRTRLVGCPRTELGIAGAAGHFLNNQLPELYAGIDSTASPFPIPYLGANVPQAWAASAPFALLQAMLGIEQDAPNRRLWVDPALPDWLPDITLTGLPLGENRFTLRFTRDADHTTMTVLSGDPGLVQRRAFMSA